MILCGGSDFGWIFEKKILYDADAECRIPSDGPSIERREVLHPLQLQRQI